MKSLECPHLLAGDIPFFEEQFCKEYSRKSEDACPRTESGLACIYHGRAVSELRNHVLLYRREEGRYRSQSEAPKALSVCNEPAALFPMTDSLQRITCA